MDCPDCGSAITAFAWKGNVMGVGLCQKHADDFHVIYPEFGGWEQRDFDKACLKCAKQFSDEPDGVYYYRMRLKDGWHNVGFFGCRDHIGKLFKHFNGEKS